MDAATRPEKYYPTTAVKADSGYYKNE